MRRRTVPFVLLIFIATLGFVFQTTLPGQSPAPTVQENSAPAQFAYGGNAAQNPAAFIGNLIFMPVRINQGKPLLFELDSSATATSVDPGYAPNVSNSAGATDSAIRNCVLTLPGVQLPMSALAVAGKNDFGSQTGSALPGNSRSGLFQSFGYRGQLSSGKPCSFTIPPPSHIPVPGKSFPATFARHGSPDSREVRSSRPSTRRKLVLR